MPKSTIVRAEQGGESDGKCSKEAFAAGFHDFTAVNGRYAAAIS